MAISSACDPDLDALIAELAASLTPPQRVAFEAAARAALVAAGCSGCGAAYRLLAPLQRGFWDPPGTTGSPMRVHAISGPQSSPAPSPSEPTIRELVVVIAAGSGRCNGGLLGVLSERTLARIDGAALPRARKISSLPAEIASGPPPRWPQGRVSAAAVSGLSFRLDCKRLVVGAVVSWRGSLAHRRGRADAGARLSHCRN